MVKYEVGKKIKFTGQFSPPTTFEGFILGKGKRCISSRECARYGCAEGRQWKVLITDVSQNCLWHRFEVYEFCVDSNPVFSELNTGGDGEGIVMEVKDE